MFAFIDELKTIRQSKEISRHEAAEMMARVKLPPILAAISAQMGWVVVAAMWTGATFVTFAYAKLLLNFFAASNDWLQILLFSFSPVVFGFAFILIGSFFARMGRPGLIAGKFPRSPSHPIYALRRIYGTAWAQVFYFKPLYAAFLAIPTLKAFLFRCFGYKGPTNFVIYPDSWVRDLPILKIGKNAYLANRCTIGSNICLSDGSIVVGECTFGDNALVGHLVIFGLGCDVGANTELGIGVATGIRVVIEENAIVAPRSSIYHGTRIESGAKIGAFSLLGLKSRIGPGVQIKVAAIIPDGATILTQADADRHFSAETEILRSQKQDLTELLRENVHEFRKD